MQAAPSTPTRQPSGPGWPVALVLVLGLSATGIASHLLDREGRRLDGDRFAATTHQILQEIQTRIEVYERGLATLQVFFGDIPRPSEVQWKSRLRLLDAPVNFDALLEVGYVEFVNTGPTSALSPTLPDHLAWMRQKAGADYQVQSSPGAPYLFPVTHHWAAPGLEPVPLGFDIGAVPGQMDLLLAGFHSGSVRSTRSDQSFSLRAGAAVPGFRFYFPVYSGRAIHSLGRAEERMDAAQGMVFATVDVDRLLAGIFEDRLLDVAFELFDRPDPAAARRLDSQAPGAVPQGASDPKRSQFEELRLMAHYGEKWALRFRSLPAFEDRSPRRQAGIVALAGSILSLAVAGIAWTQERARRVERTIAGELRHSRDQLSLALQDRERISRDLHDGTIQSIYALGLQLEHVRKLLKEGSADAELELVAARDELNEIILDLRRFLLSLEPEIVQGRVLDEALATLLSRMQRATHAEISFEASGPQCRHLQPAHAIHLLNITREAVTNSLRHGRAAKIRVELQNDPPLLVLRVVDDGVGFDAQNPPGAGLGLDNMRARAGEIGADLSFVSSPGQGTATVVRLTSVVPANAMAQPEPVRAPA